MKRIEMLLTLLAATVYVFAMTASAANQGSIASSNTRPTSAAVEQDYQKKISQPTTCGNHPYLAVFANDYRTACDRFASELKATIRASGAECDGVALASPAIHGTTAAEAMCVVRGGDVVLGLTTNTVSYLVISEQHVERLPADRAEARAAIDAAIAKGIAAQQAATQQASNIRQESRQKQIDAKRKATLADILSIRRKRCDQLISVTKADGGAFTATCLVRGREKKYEESISGLE